MSARLRWRRSPGAVGDRGRARASHRRRRPAVRDAVTRREWIGVALTAFGLAVLAATLDGEPAALTRATSRGRWRSSSSSLRRRAAAALVSRRARVLAVSAGLLWAASDTSIKALSSHLSTLGMGVLDRSARVRDPGRVADRAADLGAEPPARGGGADDRADECGGEPDDDRSRTGRLRRAAPDRPACARGRDCSRSRW